MELENKDKHIYVIGGKDDFANILNNLDITDVFDVRDRTKKRLVLSKLAINNSKLLIESNFLKVVSVDSNKNKVILELDSESEKVFKMLDNKVIESLGELLTDDTNEKMNDIELNMVGDLTYVPLVSDDNKSNNTFRLCLDSKTTLKYNKNTVTLDTVKVDDMFRFLIEIESINLYPNELLCHIKPYCHMGEIYRTNTYKLNKRTPINNYTFSTDVESVFQKVVLDDQDISLIKTEVEPYTDSDSQDEHISNIQLNNIVEVSEKSEETDKTKEIEEYEKPEQNNVNISITSETETEILEENLSIPVEQVKPKRKYTKKNPENNKDLKQNKKPVNSRKKKTT